jgi:hypothetical protein
MPYYGKEVTNMTDTTLADTAHAYASQGWPVFPLEPNGKAPLTAHGFLEASTSGADITEWWSQWPQANIGIPCGIDTFDVLDIDVKRKVDGRHVPDTRAMDYLPEVVKAGWLRGSWRTVTTPSGGLHFYYQGSSGQKPGKTCNGPDGTPWPFDFRTTGGYVAVPPSVVNGVPYKIHEDLGIERARVFDWQAFKNWLWTPPPPRPPVTRSSLPSGYESTAEFIQEWVATRPAGKSRHDSLRDCARMMLENGTHGDWTQFRVAAWNVYQTQPGRYNQGEIERLITDVERYVNGYSIYRAS